jgi:ABC-2 type transport system permease protein
MIDSLRLLVRLIGVSMRAQMQYRLSFVLTAIGHFLLTGVEVLGVWALFARFGDLVPWSLGEVGFFYGTVNIGFALAEMFSRSFHTFGSRFVVTGEFDRLLLRPRSTALLLAGSEVSLARIGRLMQGLLVLIASILALELDWTAWRIILLAVTLLAIAAFFYAVCILQALLSFWTTETLELMNTLSYGGVETAQYPMAIYESSFRRFFTWVIPLACVAYFPIVAILGVDDPVGSTRLAQCLAPLAGFAFLGLSLALWQVGVRRYTSTGS